MVGAKQQRRRVSQQHHQSVSAEQNYLAISAVENEHRHVRERAVSDLSGRVVTVVASNPQLCLGESQQELEEELEGEAIAVEAPLGLKRCYEAIMTIDDV